jgi:stringent starvation protein B
MDARQRLHAAHRIVLNVSPSATRALNLGNDVVSFEARFGGVSQQLSIPLPAVLGIYARETGQGMIFGEDDAPGPTPPEGDGSPLSPSPPPAASKDRRPKLKVVK